MKCFHLFMICCTEFTVELYIECGLTHLVSFVLLVATMILHMHVAAK